MKARLSFFGIGLVALAACADSDGITEQESSIQEGEPGQTLAESGTCAASCGGPSDGQCWCDVWCAEYGDCCLDAADYCEVDECLLG